MTWIAVEPAPRWSWAPPWAVGLVVLILALIGVNEWLARAGPDPAPLCLFRNVTGVPCPACGSTRAVVALGSGDPVAAVMHNPLFAALGAALLAWIVVRVVLARNVRVRLPRSAWAVLGLLTLANWVWVMTVNVQ